MNDRFDMGKVWDAFSGVLCDTSSIEATYFSHHALQGIEIGFCNPGSITGWSTVRARDDIKSLLSMNNNDDKTQVARQKIIEHHFSGRGTDVRLFACMPETMIPFALEWMGRDNLGFARVYGLVRGLPALFDSCSSRNAAAKKRKL
jgi:hypothetical protein